MTLADNSNVSYIVLYATDKFNTWLNQPYWRKTFQDLTLAAILTS